MSLANPPLEDRKSSAETTVGTPQISRVQPDQIPLTGSREVLNGDKDGSKTPMADSGRNCRRGKSDPKVIRKSRQQVSGALPASRVDSAGNGTPTAEEKPTNDFFPDKSGAELIDVLRQLKFAQKYAWLVGEPTIPIGLSSFNPGSVPSLSASAPTRNASSPVLPARNNPPPTQQQQQLATIPPTDDTKTCSNPTSDAAATTAATAPVDDDDAAAAASRADLSMRPKISAPAFLSNGTHWPLPVVKPSPCPFNSSSSAAASAGTIAAAATAFASASSLLCAPSVPTLSSSPQASPLHSVHNLQASTSQAELPTTSANDFARLSLPATSVLFNVSSSSSDLQAKDSPSSASDKQQEQQQQQPQSEEPESAHEPVCFELPGPAEPTVPAQVVETVTINSSTGNHSLESLDRSQARAATVDACPTKYALTSPCCMSTAREDITMSTSRSLDQCLKALKQGRSASAQPRTPESNHVLRKIVEEHLESKLPPGEAPLAGLEEDELSHDDFHAWEDAGTDKPPASTLPVLEETAEPVQAPPPLDEAEASKQTPTPSAVAPLHVQSTRKVTYRRILLPKPVSQKDKPSLRRENTFSGLSDCLLVQCADMAAFQSCPELSFECNKPVPTGNLRTLGLVSASAPSLKEAELTEPSPSAAASAMQEGSSAVDAQFSRLLPAPAESLPEKVAQANGLTPTPPKPISTTQAGGGGGGRLPRQESADLVLSAPTFSSHQPATRSAFSPQPTALLRRLRPERRKMSRPASGVISTKSSSDFEQSRQRWLAHQSTTALPPTPQVLMGACFTLVFEGCPLSITATASWINPANNGQILLFGSTDGIYFLNLKDLADSSLELLSPRRCHWLAVVRDTMMSLSGDPPQLFTHNLVPVPNMPTPLTTFDLLVKKDETLPLVCLGVYRHHSRRGRAEERYRLHLVDLNSPSPTFLTDVHLNQAAEQQQQQHPVSLGSCACVSPVVGAAAPTSRPGTPAAAAAAASRPTTPAAAAAAALAAAAAAGKVSRPDSGLFQDFTPASPNPEINKKVALAKEKNSLFLDEDRLSVVSVIQIRYNTLLVCFQDCAKLLNLNGRLVKNAHQANCISFDGLKIESVVGLRDSLLVFHPHGFLGKSFAAERGENRDEDSRVNEPMVIVALRSIYRTLSSPRHLSPVPSESKRPETGEAAGDWRGETRT
nr:unnamed protein product [Spirometra erinaceieuropaei]